jgi:hypothetical protein
LDIPQLRLFNDNYLGNLPGKRGLGIETDRRKNKFEVLL